ncbi:MAG TPA: hypothetical protein VNE63_16840 [Candidatus Acidoferrales bacterium]|nr:hypothetical protein [Candidatus Acidoferrales bacterium]
MSETILELIRAATNAVAHLDHEFQETQTLLVVQIVVAKAGRNHRRIWS